MSEDLQSFTDLVTPLKSRIMRTIWRIVRHPIRSAKAWFRFCRDLGGQMLTTARRPRANVFYATASKQKDHSG